MTLRYPTVNRPSCSEVTNKKGNPNWLDLEVGNKKVYINFHTNNLKKKFSGVP